MNVRILVVDDELMLRDVLSDYLSRQGYEVLLAEDGNTALELVRKNNFHIALLDIKIPGISGLELTKQIRAINPSISIIIMTGYPSLHTASKAIENGAKEYIVKPFRLEELNRLVLKYLEDNKLKIENELLREKLKKIENEQIIESVETNNEKIEYPPTRAMKLEKTEPLIEAKRAYEKVSLKKQEQDKYELMLKLKSMLDEELITRDEYTKKVKEIETQ